MIGAVLVAVMVVSLALLWVKRVQASRLRSALLGVFIASLIAIVVTFMVTGVSHTTDDHQGGACYGDCAGH
jgi:amino acid permease